MTNPTVTACHSDGVATEVRLATATAPVNSAYGKRDRHRGRADVEKAGDVALARHPPAGPLDQRGGQQHQAKREQADPADPLDRHLDMVGDKPQQPGRAERTRKTAAEAHVRCGDPADQGQGREYREPARRPPRGQPRRPR